MPERDLFKRWPALADNIACESFANLPTPVRALKNIDAHRAWIKCDDVIHSEYGGNKVRKLEFIIPEIKQRKAKHIITMGGVGSNSAVAVAMISRQYDIPCTVYVFDQQPSATVTQNLRLMSAYGARLVYVGNYIQAGLHYYLNWRRLDPRYYFLYAGCSNTISVFGYVNAMLELKQQIDAGLCPMPDTIIVPVGSCSTLAGLALGCVLLELPITVKGIRVAPDYVGPVPGCTAGLVTALMKAALKKMTQVYPQYRHFRLPEPIMVHDYYGEGYGLATPASQAAMMQAKTKENLSLEQTYTGKAFAAFLDELNHSDGVCLFWNTYNSQDTTNLQNTVDARALPPILQKYL